MRLLAALVATLFAPAQDAAVHLANHPESAPVPLYGYTERLSLGGGRDFAGGLIVLLKS